MTMLLWIVPLFAPCIAKTRTSLLTHYGACVDAALKEAIFDKPSCKLFPYRLYGISSHSGSLCGGHYVAYVKHGGKWYYASDSHVSPIDEAQALSAEAYVLFYERVWAD